MGSIIRKKKKISDMVIEEIISMINNGELKEGDKLPNQYDFANALGVSRPSLREALNQLTVAGAVEQKPGAGTILKIGDPNLWTTPEAAPLFSDTKGTLELIQARKELEPIAMKLAVDNMTDADLKTITTSIEKMELHFKKNDLDNYIKEDINFHFLISKMSNNRFITQMLFNLKRLMEEYWCESINSIEGLLESSLKYHEQIYQSLKNRDKETAIMEITNHINDIEKRTIKYYAENNML